MTRCNVCGNTTFHNRQVEEGFHIDGHLVMVEGIPARVCDRCGDATFDRETTEAIRRMVHGKKRPTRREEVDVFAFA
jgi:HTH-type transcriptional regulator / antitoxin MqsA